MMIVKTTNISIIFHCIYFILILHNYGNAQVWDTVKEKNGITLCENAKMGKHIKQYKAVFTINSSLQGAIKFLKDIESFTEWVNNLKKAQISETVNDSNYTYRFTIVYAFFFKKEGEIRVQIRQNSSRQIVYYSATLETTEAERRETNDVRAYTTNWTFYPISSNKTEVSYEVVVDFGGRILSFIASGRVENGICETMSKVRQIVQKETYQHQSDYFIKNLGQE